MTSKLRWSRIRLVSIVSATVVTVVACGSSGGGSATNSAASGNGSAAGLSNSASAKVLHMSVQTEGITFNTVFPQVMQQLGYFKDAGLDVSVAVATNPGNAESALISGALDLYNGGADSLVADSKGANIEYVAGGANGSFFDVVTKPSIKTMKDLVGKTFAVSSTTSVSTVAVENAAKAQGLGPKDIKYIVAGTSSNRYKALLAGQVDAGTLSPPYTFQAQAKGYNDLGSTDALGAQPIIPVILSVNKKWATSHSEELVRYMEAYQRLVNDLYDPSTYDKLVPIIAKILNADDSLVRKTLELEFGPNAKEYIVPGDLSVSLSALKATMASYQEVGSITKSLDVTPLVDMSYVEQAHKTVQPTSTKGASGK